MYRKTESGFIPVVIAFIIAVVVAASAGGYYYMTTRTTPNTSTTTPGTEPDDSLPNVPETVPTGEFTMDVTELLSRGQNLECDVKSPTDAAQLYTGKLWTTGDKGRSSLTTTIAGGMTMEANAIYKDGNMNMWSYMNGNLVMAKTLSKEDADSANDSMTAEQKAQAEQYRSKMIMNCKPWTPDMSKFETPAGVTFTPMELPQ